MALPPKCDPFADGYAGGLHNRHFARVSLDTAGELHEWMAGYRAGQAARHREIERGEIEPSDHCDMAVFLRHAERLDRERNRARKRKQRK